MPYFAEDEKHFFQTEKQAHAEQKYHFEKMGLKEAESDKQTTQLKRPQSLKKEEKPSFVSMRKQGDEKAPEVVEVKAPSRRKVFLSKALKQARKAAGFAGHQGVRGVKAGYGITKSQVELGRMSVKERRKRYLEKEIDRLKMELMRL